MGQYYGGAATKAVVRGGDWGNSATAGVFDFLASYTPSFTFGRIGFRCGR